MLRPQPYFAQLSFLSMRWILAGDHSWKLGSRNGIVRRKKNCLPSLFGRYVEALVEMTRRGYKEVTSIRLINKVSTIIYLLEGLLPTIPEDKLISETIEMVFAFSAMWSFGGPMIVDKSGDYRKKFQKILRRPLGLSFQRKVFVLITFLIR